MSHLVINEDLVDDARYANSKDVADLAVSELYGLGCNYNWGEAIAKGIIANVYDCTGLENLTQVQANCLLGKLREDLTVNCC